jgi:hypothetical protein
MNRAKAMLRPRNRMLLSHTSGLAYDNSTSALQKYLKYMGEETGFRESWMSYMKYPFVSVLSYSPSIDLWILTQIVTHRKSDHCYLNQVTGGPIQLG